VLISQIIYLM